MEEQLTPFVDDLLRQKNLSGMTEEVFAQLRRDLASDLRQQIDRALIEALPDDKLDEFNALIGNSETTEEQLQQFMVDSGIDSVTIIARTMTRFRDYYLGEG